MLHQKTSCLVGGKRRWSVCLTYEINNSLKNIRHVKWSNNWHCICLPVSNCINICYVCIELHDCRNVVKPFYYTQKYGDIYYTAQYSAIYASKSWSPTLPMPKMDFKIQRAAVEHIYMEYNTAPRSIITIDLAGILTNDEVIERVLSAANLRRPTILWFFVSRHSNNIYYIIIQWWILRRKKIKMAR